MSDLLTSPAADDKYEKAKARLIKTFTLKPNERAAALLDMTNLGNWRPTRLALDIKQLIQGQPDLMFLIKEIFLRLLPSDVRAHLTPFQDMDLDELAKEADRYFNTVGERICGVRERTVQQPAKQATAAATCDPATDECFYHQKYGKKARRCQAPCKYFSNK